MRNVVVLGLALTAFLAVALAGWLFMGANPPQPLPAPIARTAAPPPSTPTPPPTPVPVATTPGETSISGASTPEEINIGPDIFLDKDGNPIPTLQRRGS